MTNMRLFNVILEDIDFCGADLTGLVMGKKDKIIDVQHYKWNSIICICVLYESNQLVEFQFHENGNWDNYKIVQKDCIENQEYFGFCPLEDDILYYTENGIFFKSEIEKAYMMSDNNHLLQVTQNHLLVEHNYHLKLITHSFKYQEYNMEPLTPNKNNMLFVLDAKGYLYIDDNHLYLQQGDKNYYITHINSEFECYTAVRGTNSFLIKVYIKYSNSIQVIVYSTDNAERTFKEYSFQQRDITFSQMKAVYEDLLYGIFEQSIYLFDFSEDKLQLHELNINVKCQNLILENSDKTKRVQGDKEYELLRQALLCTS